MKIFETIKDLMNFSKQDYDRPRLVRYFQRTDGTILKVYRYNDKVEVTEYYKDKSSRPIRFDNISQDTLKSL